MIRRKRERAKELGMIFDQQAFFSFLNRNKRLKRRSAFKLSRTPDDINDSLPMERKNKKNQQAL